MYNTVTLKGDVNNESFNIDEYCKWIALIGAINLVRDSDDKMNNKKIIAIRTYILEKFEDIKIDLIRKYEERDVDLIANIELS